MNLRSLLAAGLTGIGLWLLISPAGVAHQQARYRITLPRAAPARAIAAIVAAIVAATITRWPVAALVAAMAGWWAPGPWRPKPVAEADLVDAIALWAEILRDAAGTPRGLEGILAATATTAPIVIRDVVVDAVDGLTGDHPKRLETVLDDLAGWLDHPTGDLVVTALRVGAGSGASGLRPILDQIAESAHEEAEMHRRIEVAQSRPRTSMRLAAGVIAGFAVALILFARDYLKPYSTAHGQVFLALLLAYWLAALRWLARLSRPDRAPRFLRRVA